MGMALDSVRANKVRASLTILGVAIGVMVVITMASAITGVNRAVAKQLETLGPKTFFVFRFFQGGLNISDGSDEMSPWRKNPWLTTEEAQLLRELPSIKDVGYREGAGGPVSYGDVKLSSVSITGFTTNWPNVSGGTITQGRNWTDIEFAAGSNVAVINDKMAETLFPRTRPDRQAVQALRRAVHRGRRLRGGGQPVRRLLEPDREHSAQHLYQGGGLVQRLAGLRGPADGSVTVAQAQDDVIAALRVRRGLKPSQENNFSVVTQDKLMDTFNSVTSGFFLVMLALSSVGFLVGGVGVVAIMMISVTERTREIGVRKALGATRREILFQFLVEASSLTLLGGTIGLAVGSMFAWAIAKFTPIPAAVPLWSVIAALTMSAVTGVFFGMYPATKASRLDPVEALRYE
jgi:putative ABC transport system permease protein